MRGRVPSEAETRARSQAETVGKKRGVRGGARDLDLGKQKEEFLEALRIGWALTNFDLGNQRGELSIQSHCFLPHV